MKSIVKPETIGKLSVAFKQNRPQIEIIGGVVGTGVSMYLSNKSSMQVPKLTTEINAGMTEAQEKYKDGSISEKEFKMEKNKLRRRMITVLIKLYGPAAATYLISVAGILDGMNVQNKRLVGLSTALVISTKEFAEYRQLTADKIGVEAEQNLYNRMQIETIETTSVNPKNGEEKKVKTNIKKYNDVGFNHGLYSFKFGKGYSTFYNDNDNPEYAINFLKEREKHLNEVVIAKDGSITTREILHRIGITDEKILLQPGNPKNNKSFLAMLNSSGYIYDPEHPLSLGITDDVVAALLRGEDVYLTMNVEPDIVTGVYQKLLEEKNGK